MKITVKTTQQKVFRIEAELSDTVGVLKDKIQQSQGHAPGVQKIIYAGKILTDDKTVESCGIKEKDFLVLMVSKPKPTPAPIPAPEAASSAPPPITAPTVPAPTAADPPPAVHASVPQAEPAPSAPATEVVGSSATPGLGSSSFLSGEALQTAINNLTDMGFPRDQVLRAMKASFNNPDRAAEYLMTGIPNVEPEASSAPPRADSVEVPPAPATVPSNAPAAPPANQPQNLFQLAQQQQQPGTAPGTGTGATGSLAMQDLRDNPQIQQLRELLAQSPELIQPVLQQLAQQNPALAQTLAQNPEALAQLIGAPDYDDEDGGVPPGTQVISVTEEERAAIQRLEALGFPRHAVIEAYLACDKNEELAANYLFEGNFED